jgi:hypothetical protein
MGGVERIPEVLRPYMRQSQSLGANEFDVVDAEEATWRESHA